jgi:pyrroline-5-carboxylate reductase
VTHSIGFIGGGNMATSLIGGLVAQGDISGQRLSVFEPNADKARALAKRFGIHASNTNEELIARSNVVVIAVKPQILQSVLRPIAESFRNQKPLIISVVAGITSASIENWLDDQFAIVRVMPNTPALIGKGASGLFANARVNQEQKSITDGIANAVGRSAWVNSEHDIDSVTALSGSGPAYFMLFIQGLIEAGESAGLSADTAKTLAVQTAVGAAELVASSELPLQTLIDNVTSPNGTTEKALLSFKESNLKDIVSNAFDAAKGRSEELAKELA